MLDKVKNTLSSIFFCLFTLSLAFSMNWMGTCLAALVLLLDFQLFGLFQYPNQRHKLVLCNRVIVYFQASKVHPRPLFLRATLIIHSALQAFPHLSGNRNIIRRCRVLRVDTPNIVQYPG